MVQLANMLFGMTITLANLVLPQMRGNLSATQEEISWVITLNLVATAIATHTMTGFGDGFFQHWTKNWGIAWLTMLPLVVGVSPLIRRVVLAVTELPRGAPSASSQGTAPVARRT